MYKTIKHNKHYNNNYTFNDNLFAPKLYSFYYFENSYGFQLKKFTSLQWKGVPSVRERTGKVPVSYKKKKIVDLSVSALEAIKYITRRLTGN